MEMNLLANNPKRFWLDMGGMSARWQRIVYEKDFKYCSACLKQGHDDSLCRKKKKEVVEVINEQKPDQVNGSGREDGWKNRKGKAIAVDGQKIGPRKEYRQKVVVQGPEMGNSFGILNEVNDEVNLGIDVDRNNPPLVNVGVNVQ